MKTTTATYNRWHWICACWKDHDWYFIYCHACDSENITSSKLDDDTASLEQKLRLMNQIALKKEELKRKVAQKKASDKKWKDENTMQLLHEKIAKRRIELWHNL